MFEFKSGTLVLYCSCTPVLYCSSSGTLVLYCRGNPTSLIFGEPELTLKKGRNISKHAFLKSLFRIFVKGILLNFSFKFVSFFGRYFLFKDKIYLLDVLSYLLLPLKGFKGLYTLPEKINTNY